MACLIPIVSKSGNSATCCTVSMGGVWFRSEGQPVIGRVPSSVERRRRVGTRPARTRSETRVVVEVEGTVERLKTGERLATRTDRF